MADLAITTAVGDTEFDTRQCTRWTVTTGPDTVYFFYLVSRALMYRKWTTGGGLGTETTVISSAALSVYDVYFDKWTKGLTTTLVHCISLDHTAATLKYRSLDVSSDTLGTQADIVGSLTFDTEDSSSSHTQRTCSLVVAENANIYAAYRAKADATNHGFFRSVDSGANWTSRTSPYEASTSDRLILFPADDADTADVRCVYVDVSATAASVKTYDDSANTWPTETALTTVAGGGTSTVPAVAQLHSSGDAYIAFGTQFGNAANDVLFWTCSDPSTVAQLTNVMTDDAGAWYPSLSIDQQGDDIYCWFVDGTLFDVVNIYYKLSTDHGSTWGSAVQFSEATADDHRGIGTPSSIGDDGGELTAAWFDDDDSDIFTNFVNSINIPAAAVGGSILPLVVQGMATMSSMRDMRG